MKMMLNNPGPTEGAALTLRQLLGAACPKMPKLGETVSQEMEVAIIYNTNITVNQHQLFKCNQNEIEPSQASIKGVQTALSPYWRCFNHLMGNPLPQTRCQC